MIHLKCGIKRLVEEVTAVWNAAASRFDLTASGGYSAALSSTNWERWLWSDVKRSNVVWTGGSTVKLINRKDVTFSSTLADATSTKFYSKYAHSWHTDLSSLPYSLSAFTAAANNEALMYDNGTASGAKTYFLTGSSPGGSYEPNTLYIDDGNGSLSANDKPIRFDFGINEQKNKSTDFGNSDATASYANDSKWPNDQISLVWHQKLIQLAILVTKLGVITAGAQRMSGSLEQCLGINRHPLMMQVERWLH